MWNHICSSAYLTETAKQFWLNLLLGGSHMKSYNGNVILVYTGQL
jgi:hypothetical protein